VTVEFCREREAFLLSDLDGRPQTRQAYASDYFEKEVEIASVAHIYQHRPLTQEIVASLNPEPSLAELAADLRSGSGSASTG